MRPRTRRTHRPTLQPLEGRALLSTITVTILNDSGPGSVRAAISSAPAGSTINFKSGLTGTIRSREKIT